MSGKKKFKPNREVAQIKVFITKSAGGQDEETRISLSRIRTSVPFKDINDVVRWIKANNRLNKLFFPSEFPQTFYELEPDYILLPSQDEFEYRWTTAFLLTHTASLREFIESSREFERAVLKSNYERALELLDEIEARFGQSFWLIGNRLALLQFAYGLEAQKAYMNKVIQESPVSQFVSFVAYYTSVRNESSVTPNRFVELLRKNPSLRELPDIYQAFIWQHLFPRNSYSSDWAASVLAISNCCSVIDSYEALIRIARNAIAVKAKNAFSTLYYVLQRLFEVVEDERLYPLIFEIGKSDFDAPIINLESTVAFNDLLHGDQRRAGENAKFALEAEPRIFDLWEIKARADAIANNGNGSSSRNGSSAGDSQKTFYEELISRMTAFLSKNSDIAEHKTELVKTALNFNSHSWADALLGFVWRESSSVPLLSREAKPTTAASQINLHPLRIVLFDADKKRVQYADLLTRNYPDSVGIRYAAKLAAGEEDFASLIGLSPEEASLATAETAFENGNYGSALREAESLVGSPVNYFRHQGVRIKVNALLKLNLIDDAVHFTAPILVKEPHIHVLIPLTNLAKAIDKSCRKRLRREICLPIIYDLYSHYVGNDFDNLRNYAYEDFLLTNGIERPSDLKNIAERYERINLIYFLENIALESVMDVSTVFEGSQDIAAERVKVCEYLIEINEARTELYQVEIDEINRRLMLQRRSREVELSKIYVDTESIKKKVAGSVGESFNRYISFLKHNYSSEALKSRNEKLDQMGTIKKIANKEGLEVFLLNLELPDNEMGQLFYSMFLQLRDEYVSGKEFGLDTFLSVRIRHGTLTNQLRSHFEALHLVTQKESEAGPYKINEHWNQKFEEAASVIQSFYGACFDLNNFLIELNHVLAEFSKNFDDFVDEIVSEWIQIKKKPEDKGFFNFVFSYSDIQIYSKVIKVETTFDEFVESAFAIFENRLKTCLNDIRLKFKNDCKNRITEQLNALQSEIEKLGKEYAVDTGDITVAIGNGRTGAMNLIDRIADWFTLSTSNIKAPFQLDDAIGLSESNVRASAPSFRAKIKITDKIGLMKGEHFNSIVDIFLILFENVVRHSGFRNGASADVFVTCDAETIRIAVENKVKEEVVTDESITRLSLIQKRIASGEYVSSVTTEGGTGFYKIYRILKHDFQIEPDIDFGFRENNRFFVDIKLPTVITEEK